MREVLDDYLSAEGAELLLLVTLLSTPPAWFGGTELLNTLGVDWLTASFLSGVAAVGRGGLSAGLLYRRVQAREDLLPTMPPLPETSELGAYADLTHDLAEAAMAVRPVGAQPPHTAAV